MIFYFIKNDYFEHETLTKTFRVNPATGFVFKIESTQIQWKSEDLNPTIEKKKKKLKSMFNFFIIKKKMRLKQLLRLKKLLVFSIFSKIMNMMRKLQKLIKKMMIRMMIMKKMKKKMTNK